MGILRVILVSKTSSTLKSFPSPLKSFQSLYKSMKVWDSPEEWRCFSKLLVLKTWTENHNSSEIFLLLIFLPCLSQMAPHFFFFLFFVFFEFQGTSFFLCIVFLYMSCLQFFYICQLKVRYCGITVPFLGPENKC